MVSQWLSPEPLAMEAASMRTGVLAILGVLLMTGSGSAGGDAPTVVGAIRWDAWTGGAVTEQVERTLGPAKYRDRLPWFAEVLDPQTVRIDGGRAEVMDREIDWAAQAGLDYWAFLIYPESSPMSAALGQYLRSPRRDRLGFCMILHNTLKVPEAEWPQERARAVGLLRESGYQTVLHGRPLVYAFLGNEFPYDRFADFLAAARQGGLQPYCVFMGWNPANDFRTVALKGFDAVSAYAKGSQEPAFTDLTRAVETNYWRNAAHAGVPYIPLVTTGWDKRPRKDHPVSWELGHPYHRQEVFPAQPTPAEIASHLRDALDFVKAHRGICEANAVIVYAWNEYDEGGWLAPTRRPDGLPDTSRLDAVRSVLAGP